MISEIWLSLYLITNGNMSVLVSLLCSLAHLPVVCTLHLYDNCESSLPLELNFVNDPPLTDLQEMFDFPLTSLPTVAPSFPSIPIDTSVNDLPLLASLLPFSSVHELRDGWDL